MATALGFALLSDYFAFRDFSLQLFLVAIVLVGWYAGPGASVLAVVLALASYNYFFTEPRYSFESVTRGFADILPLLSMVGDHCLVRDDAAPR